MQNKEDTVVAQGRYVRMRKTDSGWEYVERTNVCGIVIIVAVTDDNRIILTEQYRPPVGNHVIELPAGLAGDIPGEEDEDLVLAAKRELLEETGYTAATWTFLTEGPPSPGICTEIITFYGAAGLTHVHEGGGDESEAIAVHLVPLDQAHDWLEAARLRGLLIDPKVYIGLHFARR